jgi:hypothetical protein
MQKRSLNLRSRFKRFWRHRVFPSNLAKKEHQDPTTKHGLQTRFVSWPDTEFWYIFSWTPPPNAHTCSQRICPAKHEEHYAQPPTWSLNSIITHVESQAFQKLWLWAPAFSALPTKCKSSLIPSVHQWMARIFIRSCSTPRNVFCVTNSIQCACTENKICVGISGLLLMFVVGGYV